MVDRGGTAMKLDMGLGDAERAIDPSKYVLNDRNLADFLL
jgi:hypothetical protein